MLEPNSFESMIRPLGGTDRGILFVDADGRREWHCHHDIALRAGSLARGLREQGVGPGDTVAAALENDLPSVVALLAAWSCGAQVASLPPPRRGGLELYRRGFGGILGKLGARVVFGDPLLAEALSPRIFLDRHRTDLSAGNEAPAVDAADPLLVQFTSGSTGHPKGVVLGKSAVFEHVKAIGVALDLSPDSDRGLSWLPLSHDMGLIGFLLTSLCFGVPLVLASPRLFARNPRSWLALCSETGATVTGAPDFAYRLTTRAIAAGGAVPDCSSLRVCLSGAERVRWETLVEFHDATKQSGLAWESLMPVYGMAEATLAVSLPKLGEGPRHGRDRHVSLGSPVPGTRIRFESGHGDSGRIALQGSSMLEGYVTTDGFVQPFRNDGWFYTQDVGFEEQGELFVVGRRDEVVSSSGRNVFAEDVESVALATPGPPVLAVAAFRAEGSRGAFGLAVEVLADGDEGLESFARAIQAGVARALAVRISPVIVTTARAIPKTTSGKVKRNDCRTLCREGWPEGSVARWVE